MAIINRSRKFILLGYDEEKSILINLSGEDVYLSVDQLNFIKANIDNSIAFAKNNNISELNKIENEKEANRFRESGLKVSPERNIRKTFIYVMVDKATGYYKIGRSIKPSVRERTLQSEKPTISMLFYFPGDEIDESILHKRYDSKHVRGEWFSLNEDDLARIRGYFNMKKNEV